MFFQEQKKDREYRETRVETPSYTGGVSKEARRREDERRRRDERGIVVDSRNKTVYMLTLSNSRWK